MKLFVYLSSHTFCFHVLKGAIFSPSPQASNLKICQGFTIVKLKWTLPSSSKGITRTMIYIPGIRAFMAQYICVVFLLLFHMGNKLEENLLFLHYLCKNFR